MRIETKFLRLHTPLTLGSLLGDGRVCWLGGWNQHRIYYLVMVCRVAPSATDYTGDGKADVTEYRESAFGSTGDLLRFTSETTTGYHVFMMPSQPAVSHDLLNAALHRTGPSNQDILGRMTLAS